MAEPLKRLWKFLNTDIGDLFSAETLKDGVDSAKAVLELAKALKEQGSNVEQLAPLVGRISTLLDVLNLPLVQVVGAGLPFVSIATGFLKLYLEKSQQELTLAQCTALVSQGAYLESLQALLSLPENRVWLEQISQTPASAPVEKQIVKLGEWQLDEEQAKKAVVCFHESQLAENFNQILMTRLQDAGVGATEANILTQRIAWNTTRYINQAIASQAAQVEPLAELYRTGGRELLEKYQSLDSYLEEQIATKPLEKVFAEEFTFQDIYVPLKVKPADDNGDVAQQVEVLGLETWAKAMLNESQKQDRVMFIQGGPGRGKSVFCRMFADWVRQQLHPVWTPVLIRLRDIRTFEKNFEATLQAAVKANFARDNRWLYDRNTRFLFLLDGFDELLMERRSSEGLKEFLLQVGQFQRDCQQSPEMGHRVLITGRSLALQSIERLMPPNLERVEIQLMDEELQQQWLSKWEVQVGTDKTKAFEQFLQDKHCPQRVRELAQEPLLLYLLAAMHRDDEFKRRQKAEGRGQKVNTGTSSGSLQGESIVGIFKGADSTTAKILIYQRTLDWVLTKQRPQWLNRELTEQNTEDLRRILTEAGLCVVQSGGECASVKMIETRLKGDNTVKELLEEARENLKDNPLRNALAAFYLQAATGSKEGAVEFAHKSFGEFLCAERLKESLENWTEPGRRGRGFNLPEEQLHWEIYDLLGYGGLTPEIVEYLMALLTAIPEGATESEFRPVKLFQRLEDFYLRWCEGEFIDLAEETLAQKKTRQLQKQGIQLGQRQVDVYTGLNVMILLLELHRYALSRNNLKDQIVFYPCCQYGTEGFYRSRLLYIIGYSNCIGIDGFLRKIGEFLSHIKLIGANLSHIKLIGAKLSVADLSGANLRDTDFSGAKLNGANLIGADLSSAKLSVADLSGADFIGADLSSAKLNGANLRNADLRNAELIGADLSSAKLSDADLSGANLRDTDLRNAKLNGANLRNTDLRNADLSYAKLVGTDLTDADLIDTNLSRANFSASDLSCTDLNCANLSFTNLSNACLRDADFTGIIWNEYTQWENILGWETAVNVPDELWTLWNNNPNLG
ncbi:MAG: NACHT domain-containing protein [Symploca sp. SIO1A3]|nr:NACHT domain-containing protein [Symploca sp. SIO1A3]